MKTCSICNKKTETIDTHKEIFLEHEAVQVSIDIYVWHNQAGEPANICKDCLINLMKNKNQFYK